MLFNYTDHQDGETIDAGDLNTPFNDIAQLVNGNIDTDNLANEAVTADKIAGLSVENSKLAADSVTEDKVQSSAITADKLANASVTSSKVVADVAFLNKTGDMVTATATWALLRMDQALYGNAGDIYWDSTDDAKIKIPSDGWYALNVWCVWQNSGSGSLRAIRVLFNGSVGDPRDISDYRVPAAFNNKNNIYLEFYATAGEYLHLNCYQNSGGNLSVTYAADYNFATKVTIRRIAGSV